jgi:hypothetical protein
MLEAKLLADNIVQVSSIVCPITKVDNKCLEFVMQVSYNFESE